jgi:cell shape-determining protein MreC
MAHPTRNQEGEELYQLKQELYSVYQENIRLREIIAQQEKDREFMSECEAELVRLRALLKEVTEKKNQAPTER